MEGYVYFYLCKLNKIVWIDYVYLCKLKAYQMILSFCFLIFAVAGQLKVCEQPQKAIGYTRTKFG